MAATARAWSLGVVGVAIVVVVLLAISGFWTRRDRPPQSDPSRPASPREVPLDESLLTAADWPQFRGPGGRGVSRTATVPLEWSDTHNLKWQTDLPGPGSSSPIVVGDRVFVTCYSGYGSNPARPGDPEDLTRHLLSLRRDDGQIAWIADVDADGAEDPFRGYLTEHGYASHTPASDGRAVYALFGKGGVHAYDLDGKPLWKTPIGTGSDSRRWGSASSLVLYRNLVLVAAASESQSVWALDKQSGDEVWRATARSTDLSFGTPSLVDLPDGRIELVWCVPGELWGLDPSSGTLNWYASVRMAGNISPSVTSHNGIVYATGGYGSRGTVAVTAGGQGDVTDSHVRWSVRQSSYVPSPLWHAGHLYWVDDRGVAVCLNSETGAVVYQQRLPLKGGGGRAVYASPVFAGDHLIVVTRTAGTVVLAAQPKYRLIATNVLADPSRFNATPAVAGTELFLRSDRRVYCISATPLSADR
jgi:outer membrane protein assembly factor BamB